MSNTVQILIEAENNTKRALSDVASDLDRVGEKRFGGVVSGLSSIGKAAGLAAVGGVTALAAGLGILAKSAIGAASDAEETASLIQSSLGDAATGFNDQIADIADSTNRSFFELQQGASTFVAMAKNMGFAQDAAGDFSAEMTSAAADLGSFFNRSDSEVLLDLQAALSGSSETMQKYGIDVTETALKQMALDRGLITSASDTIPRNVRAMLLLEAVQSQASDAMGDAERTSGSFANQMKGLRATLSDASTTIGTSLLPVATSLLRNFNEFASNVIPPLVENFQSFFGAVSEGQGVFAPLVNLVGNVMRTFGATNGEILKVKITLIQLGESVGNFIASAQTILEPLTSWIGENIKLRDILIPLVGIIGTGIVVALGSLIAAIAPFAAAFAGLVTAASLLRQAWETDFAGIRDFVGGIWDAIKLGFSAFKLLFEGDFTGFISGIKLAWETGVTAIGDFIGNLWGIAQPHLAAMWTSFSTWFTETDWMSVGLHVVTTIVEGVATMWDSVRPKLIEFGSSLVSWFTATDWGANATHVINVITETLSGLWASISPKFDAMLLSVQDWFIQTDWQAMPSYLMDEVAAMLGDFWDRVRPKFLLLLGRLTSWWNGIDWAKLGYDVVTWIMDKLADMGRWSTEIVAWVGGVFGSAKSSFSSFDWGQLALDIINGMVSVLRSSTAVKDALTGMAAGAWQAVKDVWQERSPSRLAMKSARNLIAGLVVPVKSDTSLSDSLHEWSKEGWESAVSGAKEGMPSPELPRLTSSITTEITSTPAQKLARLFENDELLQMSMVGWASGAWNEAANVISQRLPAPKLPSVSLDASGRFSGVSASPFIGRDSSTSNTTSNTDNSIVLNIQSLSVGKDVNSIDLEDTLVDSLAGLQARINRRGGI